MYVMQEEGISQTTFQSFDLEKKNVKRVRHGIQPQFRSELRFYCLHLIGKILEIYLFLIYKEAHVQWFKAFKNRAAKTVHEGCVGSQGYDRVKQDLTGRQDLIGFDKIWHDITKFDRI